MPELTPDQIAEAVLALPPTDQSALFSTLGQRIRPRPSAREMGQHRPDSRGPQLPEGTRIRSAAGVEIADRAGIAEALADAHNRRGGSGGFVPVVTVRTAFPEGRTLRRDAVEANSALVASVGAQLRRARSHDEALTAAGGLCGPPSALYDVFVAATDARPVRDALPGFNADRGAITLVPPPTLGDVVGAVSYITEAADAAGGAGAEKACLHVTCAAPRTYAVSAISRCVEFGNFGARAYPEQVDGWMTLATAAHARRAETALLDAIAANSAAVTSAGLVGAGREVLAHFAQLAAGYRSRHRMRADARLSVLAPAWTVDLIRADFARGLNEPREMTQAQTEEWLGAAGIDVRWYMDGKTGGGQVFGGQAAGAALTFPSSLIAYVFAPGTFLFLDGGELDFGIVRDSTLNTRNDFRLMVETFEALGYVGGESLELTLSVCASGEMGARRTGGAALVCPV
ncbi:MAG: major capsid protein [Acidimicrobiia bacterium]